MNNPVQLSYSIPVCHLGCANCAAKMQSQINRLDSVEEAVLDFATATLHVTPTATTEIGHLFPQLNQIVRSIEKDAYLAALSPTVGRSADTGVRSFPDDPAVSTGPVAPAEKIETIQKRIRWHDAFPWKKVLRFAVGLIPFVLALLAIWPDSVSFWLYLIAWLILGYDVLYHAVRKLTSRQLFDENFLMGIATVGALVIGEYPEAVAVMLFYQIGDICQNLAVNHSRASIRSLMAIRPDHANLLASLDPAAAVTLVDPAQVGPGDYLQIRPGERVPLDALVLQGDSELDTAALTGESIPRAVGAGDEILSGCVNGSGLLTVQVLRVYEQSAVARVLNMVEQASARKAPAEQFITRFAAVYTPIMVGLAALLAFIPPLILHEPLLAWVYRALILLVISCPCALVLSVPLGYFAGLGASSARGILVKGGNYLERLGKVDQVVFDKTGTLTEGSFAVTAVESHGSLGRVDILRLAARLENLSSHPIARSIVKAYEREAEQNPEEGSVAQYQDRPGFGVSGRINGHTVALGNDRMLVACGIEVDGITCSIEYSQAGSQHLWLIVDDQVIGCIYLNDQVKTEASGTISGLRQAGVRRLAMLTGDRQAVADTVGHNLNLDVIRSELLPDEKVSQLENLMQDRPDIHVTAFVGDGINDAPVLARADIGIAMGSASDAAVESADVVLMSRDLSKLTEAVRIARKTSRIVRQNVWLALSLKAAILILAIFGLGGIWQAVFADVGVAVLAVFNSLRILRN